MKYLKFFDHLTFNTSSSLLGVFDFILFAKFVDYSKQKMSTTMMQVIADAYNETPEDFLPPSN